jgi:hypothetical protein
MTIFDDAIGDFPINNSWNTFWDVATSKNEEGWIAEFKIPFSSLRFQNDEGEAIMGLNIWRNIARKNEIDAFPDIKPDWGFWSPFKPSQYQDVKFEKIEESKPLYLTPYILSGFGSENYLNDSETSYIKDNNKVFEAGLDLKYTPSSNLNLDVTINTDFAQVEADDQQINLTRFSLFFPEKRQFFLERASLFDIRLGGPARVFYTRNIGLNDGEILPIYGGVRATGRMGDWDYGLINMQVGKGDEIRSQNFGIARIKKRIINPYSYAGIMLTNKTDLKGNHQTVFGLDGNIRLQEKTIFKYRWFQSFSDEYSHNFAAKESARLFFNLENSSYEGFSYDLALSYSGEDYDSGVGFEFRDDNSNIWYIANYGWILDETSSLLRHRFTLMNNAYRNNTFREVESTMNTLMWNGAFRSGWQLNFGVSRFYERLFTETDIAGADLFEGSYTFHNFEGSIMTPPSNALNGSLELNVGEFYHGNILSAGIMIDWAAIDNLEFSNFYQYNYITFPDQERVLAHVLRFKTQYTMSTKFSISGFVQYNSADDVFINNLRLRYNPKEGNDLYIVYNEDLNLDRHQQLPILPKTNFRNILLKYTYTFSL